jgi:hypothetical protein
MSQTARYLWHNGFVVTSVLWPLYRSFEKLQDSRNGFDIKFSVARWLRVRLAIEEGKVTAAVHLLKLRIFRLEVPFSDFAAWPEKRSDKISVLGGIITWSLTMWIFAAPIAIFWRITEALVRSWSTVLRAALTAVPVLLAVLVVIFTTSDAWRIFGNESPTRLVILVTAILTVSIAVMITAVRGVDGGWRSSARFPLESEADLKELAQGTPARELAAREVRLSPRPPQNGTLVPGTPARELTAGEIMLFVRSPRSAAYAARWLLRTNIYILFWFTLVAEVISVAALVAAAFIGFGAVAVDNTAAGDLLHGQVTVLWQFNLLGQAFIITRPLLLLSLILGCMASLTLVTVNLQDPQKRGDSLSSMLSCHRKSLAALACYLTTIADLLTMDQLRAILSGLKPESRKVLLRLIQDALEKSGPSLIGFVLKIVRDQDLAEWAGTYGVSLLAKIPPDKLRVLPSERVEFVLAAAGAAGPRYAKEIQLIRGRRDPVKRNWRREWTTEKGAPGAPAGPAGDGIDAANGSRPDATGIHRPVRAGVR